MLIRPVTLNDRDAVEQLIQDHVSEVGYVETRFNEELLNASEDFWPKIDKEGYGFWVVEKGRQLVGIGGYRPLDEDNRVVGEIQHLYVKPNRRGRGIGAKLLSVIMQDASQHFETLYIETHHKLNKANRLFEYFGFTQIPFAMGAHSPYEMDCWYVKNSNVTQSTQ
ncbi:GNAT family N-acetyltransferase [Vagococcus xieshaowenii]|uniref:GNAT family N-acetyltransferase n=1 Tax=Vagococcus xieshaowenii TaxID=2562451 RepID=A0A4Z0DBZ3_9ENTE|nr:GNAT family N-acetyltransferase [Vagococcus xieshaowenii]QCA28294.1 GNAT family N-acetyltransferase [Vagococcus xieshaowenii]TFZ42318.1 GNAT family N-acetyltransferase [Vagococcus xieshaowenii]